MRYWAEDEEIYLDRFLDEPDNDFSEAAAFLGRSVRSVEGKAFKMRQEESQKRYLAGRRPWTQKEIDFLKRQYYTTKCKHIGEALGRTERAVQKKAWDLGLQKLQKPAKVGDEIRRLNKEGYNSKEIGMMLGFSDVVIRQFCNRQKLPVVPVPKSQWQEKFREAERMRVVGIQITNGHNRLLEK